MSRKLFSAVIAAAAVFTLSASALALINPGFTPNDLIDQSNLILVVELKPADAKGVVKVVIEKVLKGKKPKAAPVIDLSITARKEQAKSIAKTIKLLSGGSALLFVGKDEDDNECAYLHLAGRWVRMDEVPDKKGFWDMDQIDTKMEGTWAGGTNMLIKMVALLVKNPDIRVAINSESQWSERIQAGKVEGKISNVQAVDLAGNGMRLIHVSSSTGDRLFKYDAKKAKIDDVTAKSKLAAKSSATAWGDFNADGRLDLASYDGKTISVWLQKADKTFAAPAKPAYSVENCLALATVDAGTAGKPAILVSSAGAPVLLVAGENGGFAAKTVKTDETMLKGLGKTGRCLVADLDGDSQPDILQTAAKGSLLYKGAGKGSFAAAVKCPVALGPGRAGGYVGDWDQDGRLDVFCGAEDCCRLWHNRGTDKKGNLAFRNMLKVSGEIAYITKPGGLGGVTCDINNDGLQDFFILYQKMAPHIFFNRGFRSTGHAHLLDLAEKDLLPEASNGQQAGTVADVTNDGAQDMIVALANGEIWVFPREVQDDTALCVRVALPLGKGFTGPVKVTGSVEQRSLGAWNVVPGTSEAFFGRREGDEVTVKWQLPGGKQQTKTVEVEDKPVRIVIGAAK